MLPVVYNTRIIVTEGRRRPCPVVYSARHRRTTVRASCKIAQHSQQTYGTFCHMCAQLSVSFCALWTKLLNVTACYACMQDIVCACVRAYYYTFANSTHGI